MLFQRRHREARRLQLLPVELGGLPRPRPDRGPATAVDRLGEAVVAVERDAGYHAARRLPDVIEGVVVVVEDDHLPISAKSLAGTGRSGALSRGRFHAAE